MTSLIKRAKTPTKDGKTKVEIPQGYAARNRKIAVERLTKAWKAKSKGKP